MKFKFKSVADRIAATVEQEPLLDFEPVFWLPSFRRCENLLARLSARELEHEQFCARGTGSRCAVAMVNREVDRRKRLATGF